MLYGKFSVCIAEKVELTNVPHWSHVFIYSYSLFILQNDKLSKAKLMHSQANVYQALCNNIRRVWHFKAKKNQFYPW